MFVAQTGLQELLLLHESGHQVGFPLHVVPDVVRRDHDLVLLGAPLQLYALSLASLPYPSSPGSGALSSTSPLRSSSRHTPASRESPSSSHRARDTRLSSRTRSGASPETGSGTTSTHHLQRAISTVNAFSITESKRYALFTISTTTLLNWNSFFSRTDAIDNGTISR